MKIYSRKLPQNEIDHLVRTLKRHEKENLNPNIAHFFLYENVAISVYKTNTVLFQGRDIENIVNLLLQKKGHQLTATIVDISGINEQNLPQEKQIEIGCDEVGTGDYFGGITTAAVMITPEQIPVIKNEMVCDSKLIDDQKIIEIYERINNQIKFVCTSISAFEYNELFNKFKNAHIIKTYAHNKSLAELLEREQVDVQSANIVLDQYAPPKKYVEYLDLVNPPKKIEINVFEVRAESKYPSVALASIVARYHFLKQIQKLSMQADLPIFLGSTNPQIKVVAQKLLEKVGISELKKIVKFHFKTTDAILRKSKGNFR